MSNYTQKAMDDARETVSEYREEILEKLEESDKASDDLFNDYSNGDAYHHESHIDKWYNLTDAAELLDELCNHEETDSGLWESQQPKEAIGTCAAYTYGNAVYSEWRDLIEEINDEAEIVINDYDEQITEAEIAEEEEDEDYKGEFASELRKHKTVALGKILDRIIAGE
jgi:uncharacterized membrane-anchored protein YhcB (DUF1043 family)